MLFTCSHAMGHAHGTIRFVSSVVDRHFVAKVAVASAVVALAIGIPTVLVPNAWFTRMTPTRWWDFVYLGISAPLAGLTFTLASTRACKLGTGTVTGGFATYLAVGCPVCNKLVVAAVGVSGALTYFAPLQPILGATGVLLLILALRRQIQTERRPDPSEGSRSTTTVPQRDTDPMAHAENTADHQGHQAQPKPY